MLNLCLSLHILQNWYYGSNFPYGVEPQFCSTLSCVWMPGLVWRLHSRQETSVQGKNTIREVLNWCSCSHSNQERHLDFRKIVHCYVHLVTLTLKANLQNAVYFCDRCMCLLWIAQMHWKSVWPTDANKTVSVCSCLPLVYLHCGLESFRLVLTTNIQSHLSSLGKSLSILQIPGIISGETIEWFLTVSIMCSSNKHLFFNFLCGPALPFSYLSSTSKYWIKFWFGISVCN